MELWIRSQNRMRLFNIGLDVSIIGVLDEKGNIDHYMIGCNDYEMNYELGTYKTKERALEILDDINKVKWWKYMAELDFGAFVKILNETYNNEEIQEIFKLMNTYEMPEE